MFLSEAASGGVEFFNLVPLVVLLPQLLFLPHGVLGSKSHLWHPSIVSLGAYSAKAFENAYRDSEGKRISTREYIESVMAANTILSYKEGIHAPVAVVKSQTGTIAMRVSGKVEASLIPGGGFNNDLLPQMVGMLGGKRYVCKALLPERPSPCPGKEPGTAGNPQPGVLVQPPSLQKSECEVGEKGVRGDLVQDDQPAVFHQSLGIAHGPPDIPRGVKHIRRNDDIVACHIHALLFRRFLNIENFAGR